MIQAHAQAVIGALDAVPNLTVYPVLVPNRPSLPYVVVFPTPGNRYADRLDAEPDRGVFDFYVNAVGGDDWQVMWAAERVYDALAGQRLTVPDRSTWKVEVLAAEAMRPDFDVDPPRVVAPILFRLSSVPA